MVLIEPYFNLKTMGNKVKIKVKGNKKKPVKPKFSSKDGGLLTARIVAVVNKKKSDE